MSKKKPFVFDYEISGTIHLQAKSSPAASWKAQAILERAMEELKLESGYCEVVSTNLIDAHERYAAKESAQ